jgi:DNA polymerase-3 subunit delta'
VASGSHPDVHRLGPTGAGRQIVIGGPERPRGIRDLIGELALASAEGGARVAIIEPADRMNEDAQSALLKTLEEPPAGVTLILCADAEEPLLPTIRSRCARLRLGPVGVRDVEALLTERGLADPPLAARVARIAGGRPGLAAAWAADPDAMIVRDELARSLLDLADARAAERLAGVRAAAIRAARLAVLGADGAESRASREAEEEPRPEEADPLDGPEKPAKSSAGERRRAAEALIAVWTDLARDLALCQAGRPGDLRDLALLDDCRSVGDRLPPRDVTRFLDRLGRAGLLVRGNVSPALVLDDLAMAWPHPRDEAA